MATAGHHRPAVVVVAVDVAVDSIDDPPEPDVDPARLRSIPA
jgi:hypothetical protein